MASLDARSGHHPNTAVPVLPALLARGSHSNAKTTGLYDRLNDDISVGEVKGIGI